MSVHFLISFLKFSTVVALTLPPTHEIINDSSLNPKNEKFEKLCSFTVENDPLLLKAQQEIPQHAQGCSVPYFGPQGHGQYPEEVCFVHSLCVRLDLQKTEEITIVYLAFRHRSTLFTSQTLKNWLDLFQANTKPWSQ